MAEILGVEIGALLVALMGQPLSKTPMAEMLGVEIADYVPTGPQLH
jgi:hypothetical protein